LLCKAWFLGHPSRLWRRLHCLWETGKRQAQAPVSEPAIAFAASQHGAVASATWSERLGRARCCRTPASRVRHREIGADGMRKRVRRPRDFASRHAEIVTADERPELPAPPTRSICCFWYRPHELDEEAVDRLNAEIARRLRAETPYVPSTSRVAGRLAIRPYYINPRTTLHEVEGLARAVRDVGDHLTDVRLAD
jgi:glutamate/tyrosine decarboxylase-like PLP-dependent enzyme